MSAKKTVDTEWKLVLWRERPSEKAFAFLGMALREGREYRVTYRGVVYGVPSNCTTQFVGTYHGLRRGKHDGPYGSHVFDEIALDPEEIELVEEKV